MGKVNILHISDVHWSAKNNTDICIVRDALLCDLDKFARQDIQIDFIVFSGDLVFSGSDAKDFQRAYDTIIGPVLRKTKLSGDRLFICPGNHDRDRTAITDYIESGLRANLKTTEFANEFFDRLKSGDGTRKAPFERLKNYNAFWRNTLLKKPPNIHTSIPLQVSRFALREEQIGIASFDSAWRCTGAADDADRNALVIGERNVDEAARLLDGCDIKIAIFHHRTDWLADFDQSSILSRLYSEFDLLMHGHVHKALPEQRFTTSCTALIS